MGSARIKVMLAAALIIGLGAAQRPAHAGNCFCQTGFSVQQTLPGFAGLFPHKGSFHFVDPGTYGVFYTEAHSDVCAAKCKEEFKSGFDRNKLNGYCEKTRGASYRANIYWGWNQGKTASVRPPNGDFQVVGFPAQNVKCKAVYTAE